MPPGPPMEDEMIGAIKIKDGLFIGDEFAAQVKLLFFPEITSSRIWSSWWQTRSLMSSTALESKFQTIGRQLEWSTWRFSGWTRRTRCSSTTQTIPPISSSTSSTTPSPRPNLFLFTQSEASPAPPASSPPTLWENTGGRCWRRWNSSIQEDPTWKSEPHLYTNSQHMKQGCTKLEWDPGLQSGQSCQRKTSSLRAKNFS